ncbi:MAG: PepSY domain-containing protein [Thermoactinospora sp.]|nr:PepSY domain-containing protein [Thermoactinospora sp.]
MRWWLLAVLALAGCGAETGAGMSVAVPTPTPTVQIDFDEAAAVAAKEGTPTLLQFTRGQAPPPVWLASVYTQAGKLTDLRIDAASGQITGRQDEGADDAAEAKAELAAAKVSMTQAVEKARQAVPGKPVVTAQLEQDDGRTFWEVELVGDDRVVGEVEVDAVTGAVVSKTPTPGG